MNASETLTICPNCGSTEILDGYPPGNHICTECGSTGRKLQLKSTKSWAEIPQECSFCMGEAIPLLERDLVVVLKCVSCEMLEGYMVFEDGCSWSLSENSFDSFKVEIAKQEGKDAYSTLKAKKFTEALREYERRQRPIRECKQQLDLLAHDKNRELLRIGVTPEALRCIRWQLDAFLRERGSMTKKQMKSFFAAALSRLNGFDKTFHMERITDLQLEQVFNVNRKTIRKWRSILDGSPSISRSIDVWTQLSLRNKG